VLVLKKPRPKITALKVGVGIILIIVLWLVLQIAVQTLINTVYFKFLLLCILGFGFLIISYLLKYG
jgi:hypothetical protein